MVDIPSTAATQTAQQSQPPPASVTPIQTTVSEVPEKIQQLIRQIQVNATVSQVPGDGTVTLNSALGSLTVILPAIADAKQQQLVQQLVSLLQSQKPVTVVVQPGTPPTQAFLLLPSPTSSVSASTAQAATNVAQTNTLLQAVAPQIQPQPVTANAAFAAIVLPRGIVISGSSSGQTSAQMPFTAPPPAAGQLAESASAQPVAPSIPSAVTQPQSIPAPLVSPGNSETGLLNTLEDEAGLLAAVKTGQTVAEAQQQILPNPGTPQAPVLSAASLPAAGLQTAMPVTPLPFTLPAALPTPTLNLSGNAPPVPTLTSMLQPGNEITVQINATYVPPAAGTNLTSSLPNIPQLPLPGPNQIIATVTGTGTGGQLILKAGDATLYVKQSSDLPVGSSVLITVSQAKPVLPITLPDVRSFVSLQQAVTALAQIDPQLAQMVMESHIPTPTPALPGALLFLMSAFKQGSVRSWLGDDAVDALTRAGKYELLDKLTEDLVTAGQPAHDTTVGEWRAYPVPLHTNNQFQMLNLYVHQQGERQAGKQASAQAAKNNVRFLIDVRMSRLGALQLDGFVQPKKLDMIVRSEHTLPEGLHQDLRGVYTKALSAVDYGGSLNFQVGKRHWLNLQKAAQPATMTT